MFIYCGIYFSRIGPVEKGFIYTGIISSREIKSFIHPFIIHCIHSF